MKFIRTILLVVFGLVAQTATAKEVLSEVPEPFQGHDEESTYAIDYSDLTAVLRAVVVDVGRSTRRVPEAAPSVTGTRMKAKIKKTANEANRFYYETFEDDETAQQFLENIQVSLEALPTQAPLRHFSRAEQLAYWLNLYNITVINEVISVYPRSDLKKYSRGRNSIFSEKLLTVAGVPLSLNDIEFTILRKNYDDNPVIMYGLYKGIIGGPNIRRTAYTGENVYDALEDNAIEFINSNRGTFIKDEKTFRVSSLYERSEPYFPDFDSDLSKHLLTYLEGEEREALASASKIKTDIDDWTVTDLSGSVHRVGGSFADSRAALMDSVKSTVPADGGGFTAAAVGHGSSMMAHKGQQVSLARIDPALLQVLRDIDEQRQLENQRKSTVEIDDIADSTPAQGPTADPGEPRD